MVFLKPLYVKVLQSRWCNPEDCFALPAIGPSPLGPFLRSESNVDVQLTRPWCFSDSNSQKQPQILQPQPQLTPPQEPHLVDPPQLPRLAEPLAENPPKNEGYKIYALPSVALKAPTPFVDHHRRSPLPSYLTVAVAWSLGLLLAIGHHLFNNHLDGSSVNPIDERFVSDGDGSDQVWGHGQAQALLVGTVFAALVKTCLATAVGIAFVQRAWRTVAREHMSIGVVDSLFAVATSPLAFVSLDLWRAAWVGGILAVVSYSIVVVTVFTPPSLTTIQIDVHSFLSYSVPTLGPNAAAQMWTVAGHGSIPYAGPSTIIQRAALSTLVAGVPTTPTSVCGNCSFEHTLFAPILVCTDDFPAEIFPLVNYSMVSTGAGTMVWQAASFSTDPTTGVSSAPNSQLFLGANIAIRYMDLTDDAVSANLSCSLSNSSVVISSDFTSINSTSRPAVAFVQSVTLEDWWPPTENDTFVDDPLTPDENARLNFDSIKDALYERLVGTIRISTDRGASPVGVAAQSALFNGTVWVPNMASALQDLFNNITLSVLTVPLGPTESVNATLYDSELVFVYDTRRLAGPYGYALLASLFACVVGAHAMWRNGFAAKAGFEAFVDASRSESMVDPEVLAGRARIMYVPLEGGAEGRFGFVKEGGKEGVEETLVGEKGEQVTVPTL